MNRKFMKVCSGHIGALVGWRILVPQNNAKGGQNAQIGGARWGHQAFSLNQRTQHVEVVRSRVLSADGREGSLEGLFSGLLRMESQHPGRCLGVFHQALDDVEIITGAP